jgi:predicted acetyltransferase
MDITRPRDEAELSALMDALSPIFNMPRELGDRYAQAVGIENFRVLRAGRELAGGLALLPMGQFFGGRRVPMAGVAVVGIRPEHRGGGTATTLMQAAVRELHEQGVALSTLYPATVPLYRRAGYELAGHRFEIRLLLKQMELDERDLAVRRANEHDQPARNDLYRSIAQHRDGYLDRSEFIWKRVESQRGEAAQGFIAAQLGSGRIEGYVYYLQKESPDAAYMLLLTDVVAGTAGAGRRLLTLLQDHRSMADVAMWFSGPADPLLSLLSERTYRMSLRDHWMMRITHAKSALEARGYPRSLRAQLHLDLRDEVIPANSGQFTVEIEDGRATARHGGRGTMRLDVRGLASLYSGFRTPRDLIMVGQLDCTDDAMLADAATAFAGSPPAMTDMF